MRVYDSFDPAGIFRRGSQSSSSGAFDVSASGNTSNYFFWLSVDKKTENSGAAMAKPPTFACMWIVRFA